MQRDEWDEQGELRELNARLGLYVARVRDLEQENRRLAQELAALRGREQRAGRWQEREQEVVELRWAVADLSRAKGEAELDRDALRQELAHLERLGAQSQELRRRRLEPELAQQQQQLAGLWADCAALEALLEQLLGEHERLREARRQRPAKLPALLPARRVELRRADRRQLEDDYALVLSWSCERSLDRYEAELRALQELEGRLGQEDLRKVRAETEESRRHLQDLQRRCRELGALSERLDEERLAQQERHGAERAEYQMIIDALEEEKHFLTMSIAGYLKDYHELLQVKAALSLEIATYRALLEGESNQWILMWDEEHGKKLPQGDRNMRYEYSNRYFAYQPEKGKRPFPAIQNVDLRYKFPQTNISSSVVSSLGTKCAGMRAVLPERGLPKEPFRFEPHPSTATKRFVTHERSLIGQRERQSFTSPYRMSRESEVQQRTLPEKKTTEMGSMVSALKESAILQKQMKKPISSESIRTKVGISPSLSYSSSSSAKGTIYETREGILAQINEQIKARKPLKEEKHVLEEAEQKEKLAKETTDSAIKTGEKLSEVEKTFKKKSEIKEDMGKKKYTVEDDVFKDNRKEDKLMKGKEENSKMDTLLTESIAANIVSDILKDFVQKSSDAGLPPDPKITSFEKKEISEDGKVKTEISIESTVQEDDLDVSNKSELGSFLKKDIKKVLDDSKGGLAEDVIEDIINAGMKGMEDKAKRTIKVEIIEEPVTIVDERMEFSTPFEVEEAEDTLPDVTEHLYHSDKEKATTSVPGDVKQKRPSVIVSHVEEVSEGDDVVDEEKYFVSTPDEYPFGYEQDESPTYGQIHIEEESTVRYSWQDEFLQGSQTKIKESVASPELIYQVIGVDAGPSISKAEPPKEQMAHVESVVIEKEIKIPHEFQQAIKEVFSHQSKDPKHQLKEALEKLEETLPEHVKQELCELTKEGKADSSSLEVDIKKVEHPEKEGLFTIVAEVNLSQTIDSDQFSTELLGEVTDQIKLPKHSPNEGGFDKYVKQEPETCDEKNRGDISSTLWTTEETSNREDVYPKESFDISRRVRHVVVGPTEIRKTEHVLYEGPLSETLEFGTADFTTGASADSGQSMKEIKLSPEIIQTTEKIIYRSPVHKSVEVSNPESATQKQVSSDTRSVKHITLDSKQIVEETIFEGSTSDLSSNNSRDFLSQMKDPAAVSTSIRHIQIDPKEIHIEREIYEGPFSRSEHSTTSPKEFVSEQIVFTGPISEQHQKLSEQVFSSEGPVNHIKLGHKKVQSHDNIVYQDPVWESSGISSSKKDTLEKVGTTEISRSTHHIQLSPVETQIGQVFHSPDIKLVSGMEFSQTDEPSENSRSIGQIKIGQKATAFTFQMDITKVGGRGQDATLVSNRKETDTGQPEDSMKEVHKDTESEQKSEESTFDQTVQLQRMVDQRSVISDEKKIALLYLNENEGEEDDDGPWF
ncbi:synemin [Liasis olivaceus]